MNEHDYLVAREPEIAAIVAAVRPILRGHSPLVLIAALSELVALVIAEIPENMREPLFATHVAAAHRLYPIIAGQSERKSHERH
jgi:hypothetical protein